MKRYTAYSLFFFLTLLMGIAVVSIADADPEEIAALRQEIASLESELDSLYYSLTKAKSSMRKSYVHTAPRVKNCLGLRIMFIYPPAGKYFLLVGMGTGTFSRSGRSESVNRLPNSLPLRRS